MEIETFTRKWGNSIVVIIPADIAEKKHIKENEKVSFSVEKTRPKAGALWGFGKGRFKKSAQAMKDEIRAGWLSDSDRKREEEWAKKGR
ncbi:MAG: AbrB/MazE/SpoVT family DNA-binding domain-containing protein [Patescibacteria group bacterium]